MQSFENVFVVLFVSVVVCEALALRKRKGRESVVVVCVCVGCCGVVALSWTKKSFWRNITDIYIIYIYPI